MFWSIPQRSTNGERALEQAPLSFERVYDRTFDSIYRMAFAALRNRSDAEDATAETYERALRSIARFRGDEEAMRAWLFGIARNVLREHNRRREPVCLPLADDDYGEVYSMDNVPDSCEYLLDAVRRLPSSQREVIELRMTGMKIHEIASCLGKADGTVKALQHSAMRNLRKELGE